MIEERHTIKPFRGGDLGVIRLDHLAYPRKDKIVITIGDREFSPIGFDTYGHPIISKSNFTYYRAQKTIAERKGESLVPVIQYEKKPLCVRQEVFDSVEGIEKVAIPLKKRSIRNSIDSNNKILLQIQEKRNKVDKKILLAKEAGEISDEQEKSLKEELKGIDEFIENESKKFNQILKTKEQKLEEESEKEGNVRLKAFKQLLVYRKQAAFCKQKLHTFVLYGKIVLAEDGHVYLCDKLEMKPESKMIVQEEYVVLGMEDIASLEFKEEIHVPGEEDVCAICGAKFSMKEVENLMISENEECLKVHTECEENFQKAIEHQKASEIIDAVYGGRPESEVVTKTDPKDGEQKTWYVYKTNQGTISIRFKRKVIVIEWHDNFKPFNMKIFDEERVTKYDRGIHAWSKEDAIHYLMLAKKA